MGFKTQAREGFYVMTQQILIVDDDVELRTALARLFERRGHEVTLAGTIADTKNIVSQGKRIDLGIVDLRLPDGNGIDLIGCLKNANKLTNIIVMTGYATIDEAIMATKKGAFHFVTKPLNIPELLSHVEHAFQMTPRLDSDSRQSTVSLHKKYEFDNIVGKSQALTEVLEMVERVSDSDSTVFLMGESGTGKELIAKAIHFNSSRSNKAFVPVNCCAIPRDLLESELFGHVKGAFTGAMSHRIGRFELANQGTLFLDEIGDMELSLQVKLLRVLQDHKFEMVGSTKSLETDVRIIAATNIDIEQAVADGRFREDLFYRLNVIPIRIPPLRERRSDIPLLLAYYLEHFNITKKRQITGFSREAMEALNNYSWPGNIRELENLVERLAILKSFGEIQLTDIPKKFLTQVPINPLTTESEVQEGNLDFNSAVDAYENALISNALKKTGWNRNRAASLLGLNRTTLVEKIKKKGLKPPPSEAQT